MRIDKSFVHINGFRMELLRKMKNSFFETYYLSINITVLHMS
jgi:hypothetical protein